LLADFGRINLPAGHAIFSVRPTAKIDQLAALGTKRPPWVVAPRSWLAARRTFWHHAKVKRKAIKVKRQKQMQRLNREAVSELSPMLPRSGYVGINES